jgi:hypothetical protein
MIPLGDAVKKVTKKALTEYFSAMLRRHDINHGIRPVTNAATPDEFDLDRFRSYSRDELTFKPTIFGADEAALHWLIQQHPEYEQKRGCGIAGFTVVGTIFGARGFAIVRTDGSVTDFSYRECLSPKSARTSVLAALRHEVADDIQDAKLRYFSQHGDQLGRVVCPLAETLIDISQSHADHAPPWTFQVLAQAFLCARGIVATEDLLEPNVDNQHRRRLADRELAAAWRSFHHELAHIRVVDAKVNIARAEDKPRAKDRQLILNRE